ncbi:Sec-independent protein translocase protein TatB [Aliarcobacter cryaerophilus]|nr:Sec-independent protein translocase protein TatB [Aliarcobacter cryaerophilus]WNL30819.1 Sec-independent protein translocase protein TatB [Arcobacter sp. AZ-2023]MCT7432415.1 Sec-independent protein translocase protein TatB [Aliarcobacter cryaerophilus]MCT7487365.1 Sec-independent protein translocase protein TatB [Aliarcobacter cryaerophilus]MCT7524870.1 Sec-independent protein translocase protein TatB [Aliarcobacter cryaerophilus]MCT7525739.1 Sec-independent protein translocase protein Tat
MIKSQPYKKMEQKMFGMGITEILLIAIVAVIALGPEKLPDAMVKIAKMFNSIKKGISDAKTTLDNELNIAELKEEANKFKAQIEDTKSSLSIENKFDLGLDDILKDDLEASKNDNEVEKIKEKFAKVNEDKAQKSKDEKFSLKNSEEVK